MIHHNILPFEWKYHLVIPFDEIGVMLTKPDYDYLKDKFNNGFDITLIFDYSIADPDVGIISDSLDYVKWTSCIDYPYILSKILNTYIESNIDKYNKDAMIDLIDYMNWR